MGVKNAQNPVDVVKNYLVCLLKFGGRSTLDLRLLESLEWEFYIKEW